MKKKSQLHIAVQNHIRENSSMYTFIAVLFLMGVICGSVIVNSLSFSQKEDLLYYLTRFFGQVENQSIADSAQLLKGSIMHNLQFIGLIWILGISIIGLPLILLLLFLKGVVIGFTVGFLVGTMGWEGFQVAIGSVLPQNIIMVPVTIFITVISLVLCKTIIQRVFFKQARQPMKPIFIKYIVSFILCIIFIGGAGVIEAYFSPMIMKQLVSIAG